QQVPYAVRGGLEHWSVQVAARGAQRQPGDDPPRVEARVSTPYRIAGRSGLPSASAGRRHGSSACWATTSPSGRTRTPLELPVPKSTPISSPFSAMFVPSHQALLIRRPAHPALCRRTATLIFRRRPGTSASSIKQHLALAGD